MSEPSKESKVPTPDPKKEPRVEKFKAFGKSWIVGTIILFGISAIGTIGNSIGIQEINIHSVGSVQDLVYLLSQLNWQTALFVVFGCASIGGMAMFFIASSSAWGKLFHLHKDADIPDAQLNKEIKDQLQKLRILPLAVFGVFIGIIILAVSGGVYVISGVNITNANSLVHAYVGGHYIVTGITIVGGAVVGALINHFKGEYQKAYDKIEPYVRKSHFL